MATADINVNGTSSWGIKRVATPWGNGLRATDTPDQSCYGHDNELSGVVF